MTHLSECSLLLAFETYGTQSSVWWIQTPRMGRDNHHQSYFTHTVVHITAVTWHTLSHSIFSQRVEWR